MKIFKSSFLLVVFSFLSCTQTPKENEPAKVETKMVSDYDLSQLKLNLDSISIKSQNTLLQNVSKAMKKGGPEYALAFCNENAMTITDSLSKQFNMKIVRISDKNRNPKNGLKSETDQQVFASFLAHEKLKDSLLEVGNKLVYYKRINTAMPTCLKCHGTLGKELTEPVAVKIKELYPNDLATGYGMNEFRGLWKIELEK